MGPDWLWVAQGSWKVNQKWAFYVLGLNACLDGLELEVREKKKKKEKLAVVAQVLSILEGFPWRRFDFLARCCRGQRTQFCYAMLCDLFVYFISLLENKTLILLQPIITEMLKPRY